MLAQGVGDGLRHDFSAAVMVDLWVFGLVNDVAGGVDQWRGEWFFG